MIQKVQGQAPFQVLASNFSIGPSNEGYTLQISADGSNYSDLFSVGANTTRMVTGVANGSYYRLKNNNSEVTINWRTQCNDGGSGGGSYVLPTASSDTLGGVKIGSGITIDSEGHISADGSAPDMSAYWTSAETQNAINEAVSGITPGGDNHVLLPADELPEPEETGEYRSLTFLKDQKQVNRLWSSFVEDENFSWMPNAKIIDLKIDGFLLDDDDIEKDEDIIYKYGEHFLKWVDGEGNWGYWIKDVGNQSTKPDDLANGIAKTTLSFTNIPSGKVSDFKFIDTNYSWRYYGIGYDGNDGMFKLFDNTALTGDPISAITIGETASFETSDGYFNISWVDDLTLVYEHKNFSEVYNFASTYTEDPHFEGMDWRTDSISPNFGIPYWDSEGRIQGRAWGWTELYKKINNTGYDQTIRFLIGEGTGSQNWGQWYIPTQAGTSGQTLTSTGGGEPVWQSVIRPQQISAADYAALVSGGTTDPNVLYLIIN